MKEQKKFLNIFILFFLILKCTNYSSKRIVTVPPILISITSISVGYKITMRAGNPELLFIGYKLYTGTTSGDARNPADLTAGTDCQNGVESIPNQPKEYVVIIGNDVDTIPGDDLSASETLVCRYQTSLNPGEFVAMRSLLLSIQFIDNGDAISVSAPSNSLIVP